MKPTSISVFEHEVLKLNAGLTPGQLLSLQQYYGEEGVPYYSLVHNGVKFCEFVGVLQIGSLRIEVLPKADKQGDKGSWRKALISMLKCSGVLDIHAPSSSGLSLKSNSILELYFELFINELEYLMRRGLIKKYRKTESNTTSLKGVLNFGKHVSKNLTHKERFYCKFTTYNHDHLMHQILFQTLELIHRLNSSNKLSGRISIILLSFPEVSDIRISEKHFNNYHFDRKTEPYRHAFNISKLLILNFHPDITGGKNNVLAIMFDMNILWEKFIFKTLSRHITDQGITFNAQTSKDFWQMQKGRKSKIRPDIVISKNKSQKVVLDTKWKNLNGCKPSSDDLQQMYVYHEFYQASKVALVYPGDSDVITSGNFFDPQTDRISKLECSIFPVGVNLDIKAWQKEIVDHFLRWFNSAEEI